MSLWVSRRKPWHESQELGVNLDGANWSRGNLSSDFNLWVSSSSPKGGLWVL